MAKMGGSSYSRGLNDPTNKQVTKDAHVLIKVHNIGEMKLIL
jgi:hypothetical protein